MDYLMAGGNNPLNRLTISRALDIAILLLTFGYGTLFMLFEVFVQDAGSAFERLDTISTIVLLSIFLVQFLLAPLKLRWLASNWVDLVIVLIVAFPLLRIFRFYRYLPLARVGRLARLSLIMGEGLRAHLRSYGRGNVYNIAVTAVVVVILSALLIQFAEDGAQEANIKSLGDALWWAMTTVTTVGYGDKFPTTIQGRVVASALMLLGIALFGILTASLSSLFVAHSREPEIAKFHDELQLLRDEIVDLRMALSRHAALSEGKIPATGVDEFAVQSRTTASIPTEST